ncbi:hypothetical protein ACFVUS_28035 [Nocardia sp. NPDC058058]|uniref:hypothetical protein n=1 Tax=Nocardia sp. NPDC058058 TaxID=3346317 RepID=UPI0036DD7C22
MSELRSSNLTAELGALEPEARADLSALFEQACAKETKELTKAAYASLDLVPGPLRRAVLKVAGL